MRLSSSAEVLVRMLEVQEPEIWKWKFRGEPWICLGLFLGVGRKHSIKKWLIIGLSGRFFEAMHQLIRSNFMGYWFGIFVETHWTQHYINPIVTPDGAMFYYIWYRSAHCYPQIELCSTLLGTGVVWVVWFSNGHKMGQDDLQLKCSTRFGGWSGFSFRFNCWIVCMCVRTCSHTQQASSVAID